MTSQGPIDLSKATNKLLEALIDFPNTSINLSRTPIDPPEAPKYPIELTEAPIDLFEGQINPLEAPIDFPNATINLKEASNDTPRGPNQPICGHN